jgi:hypothetical protein
MRIVRAAALCRGRLFRVESDQGAEGEAALRDRHERRQAVWHRWHLGELEGPATGEWVRTFAVITTDANELVTEIHDRMPLILAPRVTMREGLAMSPIRPT